MNQYEVVQAIKDAQLVQSELVTVHDPDGKLASQQVVEVFIENPYITVRVRTDGFGIARVWDPETDVYETVDMDDVGNTGEMFRHLVEERARGVPPNPN